MGTTDSTTDSKEHLKKKFRNAAIACGVISLALYANITFTTQAIQENDAALISMQDNARQACMKEGITPDKSFQCAEDKIGQTTLTEFKDKADKNISSGRRSAAGLALTAPLTLFITSMALRRKKEEPQPRP